MSNIRDTAIKNHRHSELSYGELTKLAKQFDKLTEQEVKKNELESIKSMLCKYNVESVFLYRISMSLYKVVCKRHKMEVPIED